MLEGRYPDRAGGGAPGADDLIEALPELPDLFDREPMEIEISQRFFR